MLRRARSEALFPRPARPFARAGSGDLPSSRSSSFSSQRRRSEGNLPHSSALVTYLRTKSSKAVPFDSFPSKGKEKALRRSLRRRRKPIQIVFPKTAFSEKHLTGPTGPGPFFRESPQGALPGKKPPSLKSSFEILSFQMKTLFSSRLKSADFKRNSI